MEIFKVAFFGHREIENIRDVEKRLYKVISDLILEKEYVEFLVGRNGEFDTLVSSQIKFAKKNIRCDNNSLCLVLPYLYAEYKNNKQYFEKYYDEIIVSESASKAYYKNAITIRNREMVDKADMIICCVYKNFGGAFNVMKYAQKKNKLIINLGIFEDITS